MIALDNGLSPVRRQAIIEISDDLSTQWSHPKEHISMKNISKLTNFRWRSWTESYRMQFAAVLSRVVSFNTLRPRQNGRHFPDDISKWIFLNENVWISIKISLKFVPRGPINNIPSMVQIMAWCRGDKSLSELMMVSLLTHICVTRPQWVKGKGGDQTGKPDSSCDRTQTVFYLSSPILGSQWFQPCRRKLPKIKIVSMN